MVDISFHEINSALVKFSCSQGLARELKENFSFYAANYKWDKRYKMGFWDGRLSPISLKDYTIPKGLLPRVKRYIKKNDLSFDDRTKTQTSTDRVIDENFVLDFYKEINGPFVPHEPQIDAFIDCINKTRNIILAPTSLGKSYIIHGLNAWYTRQQKKVLIIIHRAQLVLQLRSNFHDEYGADNLYKTSTIYEKEQTNDFDVYISTWQSLKNVDKRWLEQFDVIIGDEIHRHKAKVITQLMNDASNVEFRHGFTATLDNDCEADAMILEGIYGPPLQVTTLGEQIKNKISTPVKVYVVVLNYHTDYRRQLKNLISAERKQGKESPDFNVESNFLENFAERTKIIADIAKSLPGNTLVAYKKVEHGNSLFDSINEVVTIPTFIVNSKVNKNKRFEIQQQITNLKDSVAVVSFGTFSEGINIPNLNNIIIASQIKSSITIPQLIGRMIRNSHGKTHANVIEICDDLSVDGKDNIFLKHFKHRAKFYLKNGFEVKTKTIDVY